MGNEPSLRFGLPVLDYLSRGINGIITLRSPDRGWLQYLAANIMVRNFPTGRRIVYLHGDEYTSPFWRENMEMISRVSRRAGVNFNLVIGSVFCIKIPGWNGSESYPSLLIADPSGGSRSQRGFLGKACREQLVRNISSFCSRYDCPAVILDHSGDWINPVLAGNSSVIVQFRALNGKIKAEVLKHPAVKVFEPLLIERGQASLSDWA